VRRCDRPCGLGMVVTGGERLTARIRTYSTEVFNACVIDMYSFVEFNLNAPANVPYGPLITFPMSRLRWKFRRIRPSPAGLGQPVGFHSFAAPIIRYPLGDRVTGEDPQYAGVNPLTIQGYLGRSMGLYRASRWNNHQ